MSVYFSPWVGSLVDEGIKGHKVLVLGESHYHDCEYAPECKDIKPDEDTESAREERHQGITQRVIEHWKDNPHRSPLSYRVPELFGLPKSEFWEHVAFYNYVQILQVTSPRQTNRRAVGFGKRTSIPNGNRRIKARPNLGARQEDVAGSAE